MSPTIYGCVVCGYLIDGYARSPWLKEFRAVYSNPEGTFVSGVGCYDDPGGGTWIAPSDPKMRYDDAVYQYSASDEIPVMDQAPQNGRHGFVLHDACWRLLQRALEPAEVPIKRLYQICASLPVPLRGIGICWGHHYGGLTSCNKEEHYPWEDDFSERWDLLKTHPKDNPYDVPEVDDLLRNSSSKPEGSSRVSRKLDCFSLFPWEILEFIAINLCIADVLSLVRASTSFSPILSSQSFWATRFESGGDRDFLFEKRNNREAQNWRKLYQLTSRAHSPPGLKNRRRIWALIKAATGLLYSYVDSTLATSLKDLQIQGLSWVEAAGDIYEEVRSGYPKPFNVGCRLFRRQCSPVPKSLSGIAFSVTTVSGNDRITGMRLISQNHPDICLGYVCKGNESFLQISTVKGFILAIGSRGLTALQVIHGDGRLSKWFGCPGEAPVTERLTTFERIAALEVGIDGYKMVSLAAGGLSRSISRQPSIRTTGLWYPTVPRPGVCLNDDSYTGENPLTSGFRPLVYVQFGGPNGTYLRSLTGIVVTGDSKLCSVEFLYDTDEISKVIQKLGRSEAAKFCTTQRFDIDGPGGELITSVEVSIKRMFGESVYRFFRHGCLTSFKISTNRGRSAHFGDRDASSSDSGLSSLSITPGTTVTGLYASQHPEYGIISLGVVSETMKEPQESEASLLA